MTWQISHHPYTGLWSYSWGAAPAGAVCRCPPATQQMPSDSTGRVESTAPLPQDTKVSSGRSQGLSWYAARWCDPVTVTWHPCSEHQHWRKGREPCNSWGLKNSFQPQKLNWPLINWSISASPAVTLYRPWVSNLAQVACQTACIQTTETQQVPEEGLSQRNAGLLLSVLCGGNYSSNSSEVAAWWGAGATDAAFQGHLSAQHNTSAALQLKALKVHDPLQFTAALPMQNRCWHNRRCPPKSQCISLWYVSLCPPVNHRWLLHNLLWTPVSVSLKRKFFCSQSFRQIHLQ